MRDKNRIKPFLNELEKVWEQYPDMRFSQFIVNMMQHNRSDLYYIEDEEFLRKLKDYYCVEK